MLLTLHSKQLTTLGGTASRPFVGRLCEQPPDIAAEHDVLLVRSGAIPHDAERYRAVLTTSEPTESVTKGNVFLLGSDLHYLASGDVVRIDPVRSRISALYRRSSPNNSLLVTERCDNYCLMCSQPPKKADDSWLVDELHEVIPLISRETVELGITGGEPGLLGDRLLDLVALAKERLPTTALHVLSNGRAFANADFARRLGAISHHDLMLGIPVYSDVASEHDFVVQANGAFSETIRGILNLKRARVRVEIRVVLHAETYEHLPELATFIARNLLFVDHVALMGLELMGFARPNLDRLWIDPLDYQDELEAAVKILERAGLATSLYNQQLCVLRPSLHRFARKSISDWKNAFHDECGPCAAREDCGGFFASADLKRSRGIHALAQREGR